MTRIVRIQSRICNGGPARHTILLSQAMRYSAGSSFETLLVGGGLEPGEQSMAGEAQARGIRIEVIDCMRRPVHPRRDVEALFRMHQVLARERPRIVHTHTAKAGAVGRMAAFGQRVPLIIHTFHGHVFEGYFSPRQERLFIRTERALARWTDQILVLSEKQKADIVHRYRIAPAEKVSVVPLGLELDRFQSCDRGEAFRQELGIGSSPLVVFIGRLAPIKRVDRAIRLFSALSHPRAHLAIVGDGALRVELERQAAGHPRIHFLGYRDDTPAILKAADALLLTSDNEGTPVAVIEALAAGTPVVATDVGGVREVMADLEDHVLAPSDEPKLVQRLEATLASRPRVPDSIQGRTLERFSHRRLVVDLERIYQDLLERRGSARSAVRPSWSRSFAWRGHDHA
ncbi:MAG: glycosyltransferase [Myxococcota bacterium]